MCVIYIANRATNTDSTCHSIDTYNAQASSVNSIDTYSAQTRSVKPIDTYDVKTRPNKSGNSVYKSGDIYNRMNIQELKCLSSQKREGNAGQTEILSTSFPLVTARFNQNFVAI